MYTTMMELGLKVDEGIFYENRIWCVSGDLIEGSVRYRD